MKQYEAVAILLNLAYDANVEQDDGGYDDALRTVSQLIEHGRMSDGSSSEDGIEIRRYVLKKKQNNMLMFGILMFGLGL